MEKFYALKPDGLRFGTKWAYGEDMDPVNRGPAEVCPICGGNVSSLKWLPPHRLKISSAKPEKWGDFLWGSGFTLMLSAHFKEIYEKEGLSGITCFYPPGEIVRMGRLKSGEFPISPPVYHLFEIPWGGANQNDIASGLIHEKPEKIQCQYCRLDLTWRKQERVVIEEGSWDGSDIFKPRGAPVSYMISERLRQVIEDYHMKNVLLIPAEKYAYDERRPGLWYVNE